MGLNGKIDHGATAARTSQRRSMDGLDLPGIPAVGDATSMSWLVRLLVQTIRYAVRQEETAAAMRSLALTDELTGLYNRRGFMLLARQQMKLAKRSGRGILLAFVDVDGLKQINDASGHHAGDQVLRETASVLRRTFRDADILARVGGDEFAALASDAPDRTDRAVATRLQRNLRSHNQGSGGVQVSLSVGMASHHAGSSASLEELMDEADRDMYSRKQSRGAK